MKVSLVSTTQSQINGDNGRPLTAEQLIVYIARVSNPSNQMNHETADRLIAYLIKNKHWSPFEHAFMTVEIVTSRAIAQQILRHRSFTFQEFSQRYAEVIDMEPVQLRKQAEKNRQSSTKTFDPILYSNLPEAFAEKTYDSTASMEINAHIKAGQVLYQQLLVHGVAKECARMVLPLTTQTTIYMTGSVRSWIHYLEQRTSEHTQLEHQQIARKIFGIFDQEFHNICVALYPTMPKWE